MGVLVRDRVSATGWRECWSGIGLVPLGDGSVIVAVCVCFTASLSLLPL